MKAIRNWWARRARMRCIKRDVERATFALVRACLEIGMSVSFARNIGLVAVSDVPTTLIVPAEIAQPLCALARAAGREPVTTEFEAGGAPVEGMVEIDL